MSQEEVRASLAGRHAVVWFVAGAWWITMLDGDEVTVMPDYPPPRGDGYCLN